jgi:GNAT superfamily N-acetyltransferase
VSDIHLDTARAASAYDAAYLRLEGSIPGVSTSTVDGFQVIRYGRPKAQVEHELMGGLAEPEDVLAVLDRHPELADAFVQLVTTRERAAEQKFTAAGYSTIVHNYLMCRDVQSSRDSKPDPTIERLTTIDAVQRLAELREDNQLYADYLNDPGIVIHALVVDDVPAASAVLIHAAPEIAVVEYVNTLPRYRRRGYGRWLMRALHREAASAGANWVVLSSNENGRPLYEALGYSLLGYEDIYHREEQIVRADREGDEP